MLGTMGWPPEPFTHTLTSCCAQIWVSPKQELKGTRCIAVFLPNALLPVSCPSGDPPPRGLSPWGSLPQTPRAHLCHSPPPTPNTDSHLCHIAFSRGLNVKLVSPTMNRCGFQGQIDILQEPCGNNGSTHLSKDSRALKESGS